jgi:hypothetical protein
VIRGVGDDGAAVVTVLCASGLAWLVGSLIVGCPTGTVDAEVGKKLGMLRSAGGC